MKSLRQSGNDSPPNADVPRFLADESCDFAVVRALRSAGFDVRAVAEFAAGMSDEEVIAAARDDARVVLTEDKDFGQLVFAVSRMSSGVVLIRYPGAARSTIGVQVVDIAKRYGDRLASAFTVVQPSGVRISRLPVP